MSGRIVWGEWGPVVAAFGMAAVAFGLHGLSWRMGYAANALGLAGCQFLRAVLLVLAACTVATAFKAAVAPERPAAERGLTVLDILIILAVLPGCFGCYPLWPVVLVLLAVPLFLVLVFRGRGPVEGRLTGPVALRLGLVILLFTLTWYWTTSTTRQALRGLGARIAERGGANRLLTWAAGVTAARRQKEQARPAFAAAVGGAAAPGQGPLLAATAAVLAPAEEGPRRLPPEEVPGWVEELLGRFQGVRDAAVEDRGDGPCVVLRTGGSAYHFRIDVCPSQGPGPSPPWWIGDDAGQPWPGVSLSTEGK